jgi:hypothetical protein
MRTKNFKLLFTIALGCAIALASCSKDSEGDMADPSQITEVAAVNLKASSTYNSVTGKGLSFKILNENLEISDFLVNIREVELEFDDDFYEDRDDDDRDDDDDDDRDDDNDRDDDDDDDWDGDDKYYGSDDDIELRGPFELDLLGKEVTFAFVDLPQTRYEELEFEFARNKNSSSVLFNKTVLIKGTIDGLPFEFWHDFDEDVEIDFEDDNNDIIITENNNDITINFDLTGILNGIDFSTAQDANGDGLIEISPNDDDGNRSLANQIKDRMKDYIDLLDD